MFLSPPSEFPRYARYLETVVSAPKPMKPVDNEPFTEMLATILQDHSSVVQTLSMGVLELRRDLGDDYDFAVSQEIDEMLNRFYMARIGLRFLISHHVESMNKRPSYRGIIHSNCKPAEVAQIAAEDAMGVCTRALGATPEITVHGMVFLSSSSLLS